MEMVFVWRLSSYLVVPIWRDNVEQVERAAWGARLRTREVTGRDASLPAPLLDFSFELIGLPRNGWGVAPTPYKDAVPAPCKVQLPLDPSARLSCVLLHTSSACCSPILPPPLPPEASASPADPHTLLQSAHSGRAASFRRPPASRRVSAPRRRAGRCWSRSCRPADDRR